MLKRLLGITALAAGMFIGMGFVAPQKAEAYQVYHKIYHVGCYNGSTMNAAGGGVKYFTLSGNGWGTVYMGNLPSGGPYYAWARMWCGKGDSKWVRIRPVPWTQYFWFYPPPCAKSAK